MTKIQNQKPASRKAQNVFSQPLTIFGVPVDRATIFVDHKNRHKQSIEKRQRKLIIKTAFIKFFLHQDESIRCLSTGYSPVGILEQVLTGISFLYFKRAIFVFTNRRILHIPTRFNRSAHSSVSQIMYEDCAKIQLKGRNLVVCYKNGQQEVFPYISRKEKKKIKSILEVVSLTPKEAGSLQQRVHLCPSCRAALKNEKRICPNCKLTFKTAKLATFWALAFPGGGYFYSRNRFLAFLAGLLEIFFGSLTVLFLMGANIVKNITPGAVVLFAIAFIFLKLSTIFHSRQLIENFMPSNKDFTLRKI
ncbi:MAG: DUF898 domain-containing protein [Desulfobacteraceae bacterium]|nr:DUF898 domain-containing protein [Desulfobacteraceae bacterium]